MGTEDYATIEQVENYVLTDVKEYFEGQVEEWIAGVSRYMDSYCNRILVASSTASIKYFDGNDLTQLITDDYIALTSVHIGDYYGENFVATTDFVKYPAVAPFRGLVSKAGTFPLGTQNIKVTAKWGYLSSVSEDLAFVCAVLVGGIINGQNPKPINKTSEKIGNYAVTYSDEKGLGDFKKAMAILDGYKRISL